ncbi:sensor signal transduction histidine kinase [Gottschalkia purinilytica]|uniref:histidine kinase n=1 Tax=Gottschalkia purinilytica TaxID=1503 RepID=A0A0L0WCK6_GOTPU|nr:sensor histidine kinase [Gottschalkia purinilytica]KNF09198.1 sensor signal transduction histidine kinase [Gottschalkia purinilytica]
MINKKRILCLLLTFVIVIFNTGYTYAIENYINFMTLTEKDNLSQGTVRRILQDKEGYMWFGTNDGLNKYNGNDIKVYKEGRFTQNSLPENYITALNIDKDGMLWVGTSKGLTKFNQKRQDYSHFQFNSFDLKSISSNKVEDILIDRDGDMFIATEDAGINKFIKRKGHFKRYTNNPSNPKSISNNRVNVMYEDKRGKIWVGTNYGLNEFDKKTESFKHYKHDPNNPYSISGNNITAITEDNKGNIWIGTEKDGLNKLDRNTGKFTVFKKSDNKNQDKKVDYSIGSNNITSLLKDKSGTIWIGTTGAGLAFYDSENNRFVKYSADFNTPYGIMSSNIQTIYQDQNDIIWVGTQDSGVSRFNPNAPFSAYKKNIVFEDSLNDNVVLSVYKDEEGIVWAGTREGGLNKVDLKNRKVKYYDTSNSKIGSNAIYSIHEDKKGILWLGTDRGISAFNKNTEEFKIYGNDYNNKSKLSITDKVNTVYRDLEENIWVGTREGLYLLDEETGKAKRKYTVSDGLSSDFIKTIYEDSDGILWMGTIHGGLIRFNKYRNEFKTYQNVSGNNESISSNYILDITEDEEKNLWLATDNGLNKFNKETGVFDVFSEKDGLITVTIRGILAEGRYLWVSTANGIFKFDTKLEKVVANFDVMDGLQGKEFLSGSAYKSKDGDLIFGGTNGFNIVNPQKIDIQYKVPRVKLGVMKTHYDDDIDLENLKQKEVELSYRQNFFTFNFNVLDFKNTDNNRYKYMLEGFDDKWQDNGGRNYASYTNLSPGKYVLKVKGANSDGVWNDIGASVKIKINPPYWRTWWAYCIYILIIIIIVYLSLNYVKLLGKMISEKTSQLDKTNKYLMEEVEKRRKAELVLKEKLKENEELFNEKMEIEKFRNDFFVNLSHELRTPLNLILGTLQVSKHYLKEDKISYSSEKLGGHLDLIKKNCYRLQRVVNNIIDVSKIDSKQYKLNVKKVNIVSLVEETVLSATEYARQKELELLIDTDVEEKYIYCDPVEIERVVLNLISNALKFTPKNGNIWVDILGEDDDYVSISVKDNGMGIPKDKQKVIFERFKQADKKDYQGSGIGLSLTKSLIEMHGGSIELVSEENKGSEFIIKLPVNNEDIYDTDNISSHINETIDESTDVKVEMSEI